MIPLEIAAEINKKFPIKLDKLNDLISRIHKRYPALGKQDIALVVKTFFEVLRYYLLIGKRINIYKLFGLMTLKVSEFTRLNQKQKRIMIRTSISAALKKWKTI